MHGSMTISTRLLLAAGAEGDGIVAVERTETQEGPRYTVTPKAAFHEIARRYRDADHH